MAYKLTKAGVIRIDDGAYIPPSTQNRDWNEYLDWLAQGNTPIAADPELVVDPNLILLALTDVRMARVGEDIFNALVKKNVIKLSDLPQAAQDVLNERARLRGLLPGQS